MAAPVFRPAPAALGDDGAQGDNGEDVWIDRLGSAIFGDTAEDAQDLLDQAAPAQTMPPMQATPMPPASAHQFGGPQMPMQPMQVPPASAQQFRAAPQMPMQPMQGSQMLPASAQQFGGPQVPMPSMQGPQMQPANTQQFGGLQGPMPAMQAQPTPPASAQQLGGPQMPMPPMQGPETQAPPVESKEHRHKCCGIQLKYSITIINAIISRLGLSRAVSGEVGLYYRKKDNQLSLDIAHMRNVWIFVGFFIISMLVMLPLWNANRLLLDPTFRFFSGPVTPRAILSVCLSLPIFYVCTVSLVFKRGAINSINEQTIFTIIAVFLGVYGFCMMMIALPMYYYSANTYREIVYSCPAGYGTRELYLTSQALQVMRKQPTCAQLVSVDQCAGFQQTEYTDVLQNMEAAYKCSGYCYDPTSLDTAASIDDASRVNLRRLARPAASLLQAAASSRHRARAGRGRRQARQEVLGEGVADPLQPSKLVVNEVVEESAANHQDFGEITQLSRKATAPASTMQVLQRAFKESSREAELTAAITGVDSQFPSPSKLAAVAARQAPDLPPVTITPDMNYSYSAPPPAYAPTLFSTNNYQASCDGIAAKFMRHSLGDMATASFALGCAMIGCSLAVGFLAVIGPPPAAYKGVP